MLALLKLLLPECATEQRVAVLIDAIGEVLTGHADRSAFPPLQVSLVNEIPLLHNPCRKYSRTSAGAGLGACSSGFPVKGASIAMTAAP